jgi:hypothetical protein
LSQLSTIISNRTAAGNRAAPGTGCCGIAALPRTTPRRRAPTAGGRRAGVNLGTLQVERCPQALELLQARSLSRADRAGELAFSLAAELLATHFNLEAGAESCLGVVEAVLGAQQLLGELGFDGEGALLGPGNPAVEPYAEAELYQYALQQYNRGELCR